MRAERGDGIDVTSDIHLPMSRVLAAGHNRSVEKR
jgi:hypothetical protein